MGFWHFNPPEPCCNPPAGFCQCQPCRWKVTDWSGFRDVHADDGGGLADAPPPLFKGGPLSISHSSMSRKDPFFPEPPPWWRQYRGVSVFDEPATPEGQRTYAEYYLGYWRWNLDAAKESATLVDRWALRLRRVVQDDADLEEPYPLFGFESEIGHEIWLHRPELSGRWKCWGENTLYYASTAAGDSVETDPDLFVKVAPDI